MFPAQALSNAVALLEDRGHRTAGRYGLRDYEKMFCPDFKSRHDIFDMRSIDRNRGCMVVVRPDQYVAHVLPLDACAELAAFFDGFMGGRRSGAGLGDITRRRSPLRLGPAGYDRQAQFKFTRRRSTICHYGRPRPPSFGLSGPFVSSHRTRVRKASQRFVSLKAFNTEETNQRFRQRSAKVPSSNQWIITQPTPCLLRLRASKGVLSRENVNSSAVSGNTMRGAARISGARARVSCRPRLRAHPRLRYRRSQPCAMRSPFPANARQRAVLRRALP